MSSVWKGKHTDFSYTRLNHKYYVYAIKTEEHLEPIYVGKGSGNRARNHKMQPGNKALAKVLNKYQTYFLEILSSSDNEDVIFQLERSFISKFGKIIEGGRLLNFADGGANTAKSYFSYEVNRKRASDAATESRGKAVFVDGFIFPSRRFAARTLNTDRNHIKYLTKVGRAFDINEDWKEKDAFFQAYLASQVEKYLIAVAKSQVQKTTNRPVIVSGVIFGSLTEAARELGVHASAIGARIRRGNQKETYYLDEYYGE